MKKLALLATLLLAALLPLQAQTVVYSGLRSYAASAIGADTGVRLIGSAISWHKLTWTKSGTVTVCSVQVDSSADNITWGDGDIIAVQDCSSNGATIPYNFTVNYVRIHFVTTFTGTGSVTAVWTGYISRPGGAVGPATANQVAYFTGTDTVGGDTGLTYDPATGLTIGGTGLGNITPAALPGAPVAGNWGILAGSPDTFWFFNDTAVQYALTKPVDLYGSSPAALLVTKAAGADPTTDNCVKWLAGGGVGDAGAACGGSSLGYIIDFRTTTSTSPADSTSYYFGNYPTLAANLPTGYADIDVPKACTAKRAEFKMVVSGTAATNENVTVDFWLNNATSFGSVTQQWDTLAHATSIVTGLTQALAAGDLIEVRIQTPAWATNPTNVHGWAQLYCE
jgi:hypothetical protein